MVTHKHKTLGTFRREDYFGDIRWNTTLEIPSFASFKDYRDTKSRRTKKVDVHIFQETPTKAAFAMLAKIKRNQKTLVKNIKLAFFNDFNGVGPDSGMWWRLEPVNLALSCREAMDKKFGRDRIHFPDDLDVLLYAPSIEISNENNSSSIRTLVDMGAIFEDDHGVSALTDGKTVLGLGYSGDASEFSGHSTCPHCGRKSKA
jgi:hypothetical protein